MEHAELLELMGSRASTRRAALYARCRRRLTPGVRRFWDARRPAIEHGIGEAGKFEHYFALFRRVVLPLVHPKRRIRRLLQPKTPLPRSCSNVHSPACGCQPSPNDAT